jgi:hypothetical protein
MARNIFGGMAFVVAAIVIMAAMSPWVPDGKEKIAYMVLGYVLSWPSAVLQYFFGASIEKGGQSVTLSADGSGTASVTSAPAAEPVLVEPAA